MSSGANATFQSTAQLVDEFKKSGEFDRLRRQLLTQFTNSDDVLKPLMTGIEDISKDKLATDKRLEIKMKETIHVELMQEVEKYPMIQQAVSNLSTFKDEAFLSSIEKYLGNIIRGENNDSAKLWQASSSQVKSNNEEVPGSTNAMEVELENGEVPDDKPMKM